MKPKTIFFLVCLFLYMGIYTWKYFQLDVVKGQPHLIKTTVECGVVLSNYSETHRVRHGYRDDYYLKVQYANRTEVTNVDGATYFDAQVGKSVCFQRWRALPFLYWPALALDYFLLGFIVLGGGFFIVRWFFT